MKKAMKKDPSADPLWARPGARPGVEGGEQNKDRMTTEQREKHLLKHGEKQHCNAGSRPPTGMLPAELKGECCDWGRSSGAGLRDKALFFNFLEMSKLWRVPQKRARSEGSGSLSTTQKRHLWGICVSFRDKDWGQNCNLIAVIRPTSAARHRIHKMFRKLHEKRSGRRGDDHNGSGQLEI